MTQAGDDESFVEGVDYYWEGDFIVFTAHFLEKRGYCCRSGCRHCPYGYVKPQKEEKK